MKNTHRLDDFIEAGIKSYWKNKKAFIGKGFVLRPSNNIFHFNREPSPVFDDMHRPWNKESYLTPRLPVRVGDIKGHRSFSLNGLLPRVNNMPLKLKGEGNVYHVPVELAQFLEPIQMMIDHMTAVNPKIDDYNVYITVRQDLVKAGKSQRHPEIHVDGIQGARYKPKLIPDLGYIITDGLPTRIFYQPFNFTHYNEDTDDLRIPMKDQAKEENVRLVDRYAVYLWDPYVVHQAQVADEDTFRTFIRLEFSQKQYDSLGDTKSPVLNYDWNYQPRPIPKDLRGYLKKGDNAMTQAVHDKALLVNGSLKGGIDLTPANMNLQTHNSNGEIKFNLDPAMLQQLRNVPGFVPVIIKIQPMTNLRLFLGLEKNASMRAL